MATPINSEASNRAAANIVALRNRRLLLLLAAQAIWMIVPILVLHAQTSKPTQYDVEAAYLFQFGKFLQWPTQPSQAVQSDFTICVLGRDPFGDTLDSTIKGEDIDGSALKAKRIAVAQEAAGCRVLFISSSEQTDLPKVLDGLGQRAILTVSDIPDFTSRGGMIGFVLSGNKVRFQVNRSNAEKVGLTLSSQLLKVALSVR